MRSLPLLAVAAAAALAACSSNPANVAGAYTVAVTNKDNGCNLMNWTVGNSTSGIPVTITQSGAQATATVGGLTAPYLDAVLGSHQFDGSVDGAHFDATLYGTRQSTSGNCSWTYNAILNADLTGNALQGTIDYEPKTNNNPDCAAISGCKSTQEFSGTRPPP